MEYKDEIDKIKENIFTKVREYYNLQFNKIAIFNPGETKINYAGRVFNELELVNLIDSALEFWLTEGRYVKQLQMELSSFIGVKHCLFTTSGSAANLLAISTLTSNKIDNKRRLKPGDEIITVAAGFPTTIFPIIQNKAIPVFVDIELETYNINPEALNEALSKKSKAVIIAHTLGNPFDIDKVKSFCDENELWLIEDNCDALGSKYGNNYTGSFGDISTCSFYPAHHITMGEGGAILTSNDKLYQIMKSFRDWGRDCWCPSGQDNTCKKRFEWKLGTLPHGYDHKYIYSEFGYNLKITDLQAAIGVAQLKKLPQFIKARINNHQKIYKGLKPYENMIILPEAQTGSIPSWFGFLITLKDGFDKNRTEIIRYLESQKIQTRLLFAGNIVRQPVFDEMRKNKKGYRVIGDLTNTDKVMNDSFWIGVYPGMSNEMINYMIEKISEVLS